MTKPASWQDKINGDVKDLEEEIRRVRAGSASYAYVDTVLKSFEKRLEDLEDKVKVESEGKNIKEKNPYLKDPMRPRVVLENEVLNNMSGTAHLQDIRRLQALMIDIFLDIRGLLTPVCTINLDELPKNPEKIRELPKSLIGKPLDKLKIDSCIAKHINMADSLSTEERTWLEGRVPEMRKEFLEKFREGDELIAEIIEQKRKELLNGEFGKSTANDKN